MGKELSCWMDKHAAIYRELETTYNEMYHFSPGSPFHFIFFFFHFITLMNGVSFFSNFYIHYTNVSRSFYHPDTFFLLLVQIAADMLSSSSSHRKHMKDRNVVL